MVQSKKASCFRSGCPAMVDLTDLPTIPAGWKSLVEADLESGLHHQLFFCDRHLEYCERCETVARMSPEDIEEITDPDLLNALRAMKREGFI